MYLGVALLNIAAHSPGRSAESLHESAIDVVNKSILIHFALSNHMSQVTGMGQVGIAIGLFQASQSMAVRYTPLLLTIACSHIISQR